MSNRDDRRGRPPAPAPDGEPEEEAHGPVVPAEEPEPGPEPEPEDKPNPRGSDAASSGEGGPIVPPEAPESDGDKPAAATKPPPPKFDRKRLRRRGQDPMLDTGVDTRDMWRIFRIIAEFVEGI